MKKMIFYIFLVLTCLSAGADTLPNKNSRDTISQQKQLQQLHQKTKKTIENSNDISSITLAVNAINNIISWTAAIIAIYTLVIALFGFFGYRHVKDNMKNNIKRNNKIINDKIVEINQKEQKFNDCLNQTKAISGKLDMQDKYMCKTNSYLFEALDKLANQISDTKVGKVILKENFHGYQITNLYSIDRNKNFASLAYMQQNGSLEDIEHLEYFSNFDLDANNKIWAREIIGVIKHKNAL